MSSSVTALLLMAALFACTPSPASPVKGPLQTEQAPGPDSPVVVPTDTWSWVPVPGSECANGTPTGFGVNPHAEATRLVVFLEGGGLCASGPTCDPNGSPAAAHLGGFGDSEFLESANHAGGILDRQDVSNPLAQASYVLVPYCTGDLHSGDKVAPYGTHHRGFANLGLFLRRIVPTFPHVEQVILAGSSAGGMGALWNWHRVQQAFGARDVILLDDSGPFLGPPIGSFAPAPDDPWGGSNTLPAGCSTCWPDGNFAHGPFNLFNYYGQAMGKRRGLLICSTYDHEMSRRYGLDGKGFAQTLEDLRKTYIATNPGFHVFFLDSARHVWLGGGGGKSLGDIRSGGKSLAEVVRQLIEADPQWGDVLP